MGIMEADGPRAREPLPRGFFFFFLFFFALCELRLCCATVHPPQTSVRATYGWPPASFCFGAFFVFFFIFFFMIAASPSVTDADGVQGWLFAGTPFQGLLPFRV
jgi:hypothetical protein